MNDFRNFDQLRTNELYIQKHKWFFPYFELTDGQFVYAKLSYKGTFKRYAIIETAEGTWTAKRAGFFSRALNINLGEEKTIGQVVPEVWKRNVAIRMDNGFEGTFLYKKLFTNTMFFTSSITGDLFQLKHKAFGISKPFEIELDKNHQRSTQNDAPPLPLLILLGVNLILLRQAQAAAAS